jgi:uncharacterized membrane protein (DUF4010 family)
MAHLQALPIAAPVQGLLTALGIGLMIGVVRERMHDSAHQTIAGIRTHILLALVSAVAMVLGLSVLIGLLLVVGGLVMFAYRRSAAHDAGLTGEMALLATTVLSAFAQQDALLAAAAAVVVAGVLFAKRPLRRFAQEIISEQELQDALLLAGAALLVLPWLPREAVDPWSVLVPASLWRLVILLMAVGMFGEVSLRLVGARWGYALAGFFAGLASSTAVVASFGNPARSSSALLLPAVSAALLANLASWLLFGGVLAMAAPQLLVLFAWPLATALLVLCGMALPGMLRTAIDVPLPASGNRQVFRLSQALLLAALIGGLLLLSAWLQHWMGAGGGMLAAVVVSLAEVHAAAASVAQLFQAGSIQPQQAQWSLFALLATSSLAKIAVAFVAGGRRYGSRVAIGLCTALAASATVTWLQPF